MRIGWLARLLQVSAMTLTIAAILQELEKPAAERQWQGKIARFFPYDFRFPALEKLRDTYWNPAAEHIFMPPAFGAGWGINFYALLEKLRFLNQNAFTEEDFLMPTKAIKELLSQHTRVE